MNTLEVAMIFDKALSLKLGQSIEVSVKDKGQAFSLRTMLYRERKKLLEQGQNTNISFSTTVLFSGGAIVSLTNEPPVKIILKEENGKETPLILDFKKKTTSLIDQDRERIIRMMYEDALSQKDILDYFKDLKEDEITLIEGLFKEEK